ncbi:MAG: hypothetical protein J7L15_03205 [Clostridiales bacterium]|nr:hypothetical protein [Clostridiales bacterium]
MTFKNYIHENTQRKLKNIHNFIDENAKFEKIKNLLNDLPQQKLDKIIKSVEKTIITEQFKPDIIKLIKQSNISEVEKIIMTIVFESNIPIGDEFEVLQKLIELLKDGGVFDYGKSTNSLMTLKQMMRAEVFDVNGLFQYINNIYNSLAPLKISEVGKGEYAMIFLSSAKKAKNVDMIKDGTGYEMKGVDGAISGKYSNAKRVGDSFESMVKNRLRIDGIDMGSHADAASSHISMFPKSYYYDALNVIGDSSFSIKALNVIFKNFKMSLNASTFVNSNGSIDYKKFNYGVCGEIWKAYKSHNNINYLVCVSGPTFSDGSRSGSKRGVKHTKVDFSRNVFLFMKNFSPEFIKYVQPIAYLTFKNGVRGGADYRWYVRIKK